MKWTVSLVLGGALTTTAVARAEPPPRANPTTQTAARATSTAADADAYCRWITAAAASESDPLLFPSLFAAGGYTSGADASATGSGATTRSPTPRLIAGASYSFGADGLNRGLALRSQAAAECRLYAAMSALRAFVENHHDATSRRALTAKVKVLDDAIPRAAEILALQKARLAQSRATVEEIDATALRVDGLRKLAGDAHAQIDAMAALPAIEGEPIRRVQGRRDEAEEDAERAAARVRRSRGWDLSVRGGYDRVFGAREDAPVFAMATLTVSLGWLFQGANDDDAVRARRAWARSEVLGMNDRVEQAVQRLRATRDAESARLREVRILLVDMEARMRDIAGIGGDRARSYGDALWFDLVRTRAEHAYLEEHVRELAVLLDESGG
jgi:hypothetical protein